MAAWSRLKGRKPSPAMIVAMIALFVALGGGATAGILITGADIQDGSITGNDIRNNSILSRDVRNGQLTGNDIRNNSVLSRDIRDGQLRERDFADGVLGGAYWAVVTADAQLDRGKGVQDVTRINEIAKGGYRVEFDKPIADCAWTATAGSAPGSVTPIFGSFSILLNLQANDAVGVFVLQNNANNPALQDTPFHLAVHCGADEQQEEQ
jgi:hypothetical protein